MMKKNMTSYVFMPENQFSLCSHIGLLVLCRIPPPPVGWGQHNIVLLLLASALALHQLLRDPLFKLLGVACFLFPRSLSFDFCYDLDILGSRTSFERVFVVMSFSLFCIKCMRGFSIKHGRKLPRHLAHDTIIVDL